MNAPYVATVADYLAYTYHMPIEVARKFVAIKQVKKRDWTIKSPPFMRLANWWAKRYGGGIPFSQLADGAKIVSMVVYKGKLLIATERELYTEVGKDKLQIVRM